jgi:hypothetical protein
VICRIPDAREYYLFDVDPKEVEALIRFLGERADLFGIRNLLRTSGHLGVSIPIARVVRRIQRGTVKGESGISTQIERLSRALHHAEPHVAVLERRLDSTDAGRSVATQSRQGLVAV